MNSLKLSKPKQLNRKISFLDVNQGNSNASTCIQYKKWITCTRFCHHAMEASKSYHIVRRGNTNQFFFASSLVFSAKKFVMILFEIPSVLDKLQIYN